LRVFKTMKALWNDTLTPFIRDFRPTFWLIPYI
jgi:hypothetical protein